MKTGVLEEAIDRIGAWGNALGSLFMVVVIMTVVAGVVWRFLGRSLPGSLDLVETFMVVVGSFSFVYCQMQNRHTKADVLVNRLRARSRARFESFTTALSVVLWGVMTWAGTVTLLDKFREGEHTDILKVSIVPFRLVWVFASLTLTAILVLRLIRHLRQGLAR